jgi:transketolase
LAALRSIPNLTVIRPADANEVAVSWLVALEQNSGPTALALTRQAVPTLNRGRFASAEGLRKGAYVLADLGEGEPQVILMASGSEVSLIVEAGERLSSEGIAVRLVSFPSWELFSIQDDAYQKLILPAGIRARVAVEAGVTQGWERWVGAHGVVIGLDQFGASAPYEELYRQFGITVENILLQAHRVLKSTAEMEA